jgi:hypothetical protein
MTHSLIAWTPGVEEAIQLVASRDAVYFDLSTLAWKSSIPTASAIRTQLGVVRYRLATEEIGAL